MTATLSTNKFGWTVISTPTMDVAIVPNREDRDRNKKARIYVSGIPDPAGMEMPPFTRKGEDLANDAAWRAYNRAELALRKPVIAEALRLVAQWVTPKAATVTATFSRKAGCGCGCSPGFVVSDVLRGADYRAFEIHATVKKPVVVDLVDSFAC